MNSILTSNVHSHVTCFQEDPKYRVQLPRLRPCPVARKESCRWKKIQSRNLRTPQTQTPNQTRLTPRMNVIFDASWLLLASPSDLSLPGRGFESKWLNRKQRIELIFSARGGVLCGCGFNTCCCGFLLCPPSTHRPLVILICPVYCAFPLLRK